MSTKSPLPEPDRERKFSATLAEVPFAEALLECRCDPDGKHPEGVIHSIYFDSAGLRAYGEKDNGELLKRKVRLRWYGGEGTGAGGDASSRVPAFLEVKDRFGPSRDKLRMDVEIPRSWTRDDVSLDQPVFTEFARERLDWLTPDWTPVARISYRRRRYVCPESGLRVSLDWDIRADVFNRHRFPWALPVALDAAVCEFKGPIPGFPDWTADLQGLGFRFGSFSKYGECIERLLTGIP